MSFEPMSREERERLMASAPVRLPVIVRDRYEATVRAVEAERDRMRAAIETVLADEETGAGGWGPDVTMAAVLRDALKPPP